MLNCSLPFCRKSYPSHCRQARNWHRCSVSFLESTLTLGNFLVFISLKQDGRVHWYYQAGFKVLSNSLSILAIGFLSFHSTSLCNSTLESALHIIIYTWVQIYSLAIVGDGILIFFYFPVCEPSIAKKISLGFINLDGLCEIFNGLFWLSFLVVTDTPVIIAVGIIRVNLQRTCVVTYSFCHIPDPIISETSIKVCLKVIGIAFDSLVIELYCSVKILSLSRIPTSIVIEISLLLDLLFAAIRM